MSRPDGFVLAGGRSRRMGADKARLDWGGRPMALVVAEALGRVCGRVAIVRRAADPAGADPWPIEVVYDADHAGTHPLFGVAAALDAARTGLVVVVSCDVPRIGAGSLARLVDAGPAVAWDGARVHPLVAAYPKRWAGRALEAARRGASARGFAEGCARVPVDPSELTNVNRPEDLDRP